LYARLFPAASWPALNELSQIGLVLFMFLVGLHLDLTEVCALRRVADLASLLSIVVPFVLGLALARPLHVLAPSSSMLPFSLLIAVSMSIRAFPVLVPNSGRSETERNNTGARRDRMRISEGVLGFRTYDTLERPLKLCSFDGSAEEI
jgi:Kef-type K+ transport system membrane component KefB